MSESSKHIFSSTEIQISWLNALIANLPQAVLFEDDNHNILITNTKFCKLFGLAEKPEEIKGKNFIQVNADLANIIANPSQNIEQITTLTSLKKPVTKEHLHFSDGRILSRDYMPIWIEGNLAGHLWTFLDDTDKIKADALLNEQKTFYENVLNQIPTDIAVFSADHKYLFLNPVAVKDEELRNWLIGKTDIDYCLLRGKDISIAEKRRQIFNHIADTKKEHEWEEKTVNKDGEIEYHVRRMSPVYDNDILKLVIGYGVNITERKLIEQKIQLSEKKYRDLFNYSQAIICTHNMKGDFLSANPALLDTLGYDEDEILSKNLKDLLLPEDRDGFDEIYLSSIANNTKVKGIFRILHKSGKKIYLLYQNYKVAATENEDAYIVAFAQDVTDRIKAEKQLKEAKKITEETAKTKEHFLANMSHEIRTPMNGILGITSLLLKTGLNNEQREYLSVIQSSAQNLLTIINDILDLEKVATGRIQLEEIPFDLINKLESVVKLFRVNAAAKGVELTFHNTIGRKLHVKGDPTRLNQVLNNLISNAIKFTHEGEILVKAEVEKELDDFIRLRFAVKDTGIGIDEDKLVKIFQPFTQAYPETSRKYGGTGLGLAITKNLIELQGGSIWVDSKPRKGSTFYFSITYQKSKEGDMPANTVEKQIRNDLGKLKVLLAEDNEVNQLLAKSILQYWGFDSEIATTGNEVLQLLQQEDFDVILMDIQMPEKSGLEAAREIRNLNDNRKKNIPIIALTANALRGEEKKYIAAGMNDYLTKPFKEVELYEVISRVLNKDAALPKNEAKDEEIALPEPGEKLYDLKLVNELARNNEDFVRSLVQLFLDTVPVTSKEMVESSNQQNWEQTGKLAHKLKSTIDTMLITSIKEDIRSIEMSGKQKKNLESIPALVKKVDFVIGQTAQQLKADFGI